MSTDQEARRTASDPPDQGEPEGPNYIARSVTAKIDWLQRAISPWTRRWLEPEAGGAASQAALTVGNTQRLVGRVQRLVERGTVWRPEAVSLQPAMVDGFAGSIVNRFPDTGAKYELRRAETGPAQAADLVLAGAGEPAPGSAQPGGQSFQPFTSLEAFRKAVEAKQRGSQGEPAAAVPPVQRAPAEPHQVSPPAQPQVQRAPAELPKARRLARSLPPGSRPVSRVEEVHPGVEAAPKAEATLQAKAKPEAPPAASPELPGPPVVQRQTAEAQPPPVLAEEVPPPAEAGPLPPAAGPATPPAGPKMPVVQRQPEPGPAIAPVEGVAPARPADGVEPPRPPAVQRQAVEAQPSPAQESSPAAAMPPSGLDMPLAQRQPESGPATAPVVEPPAVEATRPGPLPAPEMPLVQRRVAEEAPAQSPPQVEAGPPAPPVVQREMAEEAPAQAPPHAEAGPPAPLAVRRRIAEEAPAQPVHAEPGPPAVQRQTVEGASIPARPPSEQAASPAVEAGLKMPDVQRQVAGEAPAQSPAYAGQVPSASPPAGLDMPLVQRQPVEASPSRKEEAPPSGPEMPLAQRQEAELESPAALAMPAVPVIEAVPPGRKERPLVQRQPAPAQQPGEEEAPPAPPVIEEAAPAGPEMPLARRQATEVPSPRQEEAPPLAEAGPPVAPVTEAAPSRQGPSMPVVQRQSAVTPPAPAPLPREEEAPPAAGVQPPSPPAGAEMPPARPELPLVQRSPQAGAGLAQVQRASAPDKPAAGLEGEVMARAASRAHLPLIEPPLSSQAQMIRTKRVEQTAVLPQARAHAHPGGSPESPASISSWPAKVSPEPSQRAQSGWAQVAAADLPLPPALQRSVAPARPISTPLIQRQPEVPAQSLAVTPRSEPWRERVVQRADGETPETPPSTVTPPPQPPAVESAPPDLDNLARQIYPLIKRMLAVERERKWGR